MIRALRPMSTAFFIRLNFGSSLMSTNVNMIHFCLQMHFGNTNCLDNNTSRQSYTLRTWYILHLFDYLILIFCIHTIHGLKLKTRGKIMHPNLSCICFFMKYRANCYSIFHIWWITFRDPQRPVLHFYAYLGQHLTGFSQRIKQWPLPA